ncbi:hypothetical protein A9Q93_06270 [Nonlabens dokdonensis]|uniref:Uncharacterized protein n=1 Tax=Nonlabens dokdonensis TaxID=328515 RepID=A0A1Z8AZJ9_9FLAO|nr:hypothetical protein A9Q93_06270 [Nonlabens dokdonensis]
MKKVNKTQKLIKEEVTDVLSLRNTKNQKREETKAQIAVVNKRLKKPFENSFKRLFLILI